jgi:hypothetical protein
MLPKDLTEQQEKDLIESYQNGATIAECEQAYGFKPGSLSNWFSRRGIKKIDSSVAEIDPAQLSMRVRHDQQVSGLKAEAKRWKSLYESAIQSASFQDNILSTLSTLITALPVKDSINIPKVPTGKVKGMHAALALVSDIHAGERVDREVMGGLSHYDLNVFREYAGAWVYKVLHLVDLRRSRLEIPTLHIFGDGDFISGLIHDELLKTNQVNVLDQTVTVAYVMAQCLAELAGHFEEIYFSGTVGNHGRVQQKVEFKSTYQNWDFVVYQMMAFFLKDYTNIHFDLPKSLWTITDILGTKFLHLHGHGIRSWSGIPFYGISRSIKSLREALAVGDETFDGVAMGHFHVPMYYQMPPGPLLINGCWKGGDEFALNGLHTITRPAQILAIINDDLGLISCDPIYLDDPVETELEFSLTAPNIWVEAEV